MTKLSKLAAVMAAVPVLAISGAAFADSPGQLEGGSFVYQVKNVTQSGTYGNTINATACDEVQYRVWLHNTEFGNLSNVTVKVGLPSGSTTANTSNMTATTDLGGTTGTSGSATVNISSAQSVSYENGTSVLYAQNGTAIKTLPDTITGNGVNIGTLNGSTTEYINFKAKVSCPTPTPTPTPKPTPKPATLPNTGAGDVVGIFAGASAAGTAAHAVITRRRK